MNRDVMKYIFSGLFIAVGTILVVLLFLPSEQNEKNDTLSTSESSYTLDDGIFVSSESIRFSSEVLDDYEIETIDSVEGSVESDSQKIARQFLEAYLTRTKENEYLEEIKPFCSEKYYQFLQENNERLPLTIVEQKVKSIHFFNGKDDVVENDSAKYYVTVVLITIDSSGEEQEEGIAYFVELTNDGGWFVTGAVLNGGK